MGRRIRPEHLSRVELIGSKRGNEVGKCPGTTRLRHSWHRVDPQNDWRLQLLDLVPAVSKSLFELQSTNRVRKQKASFCEDM